MEADSQGLGGMDFASNVMEKQELPRDGACPLL